MKTKISHLGRSSVSVILAVMMLLSTMLIGTVSTVNAIGADSSYTVHEGETLYLNLSNTGATEANFFEGNYIEGSDYFSSPLPDNKIVSVKLKENIDFHTKDFRLFGICVGGKWKEQVRNNTAILPTEGQNMVVVEADGTSYHWATYAPVADKVSLTASATSVKVGKDVTLTATLGALATDLDASAVNYTFKRTNGDEVTGSTTDGNTYKFTPTKAGEYKFEVTASAKGHSPVKAVTTVNVLAETRNVTFSITGKSGTVKINDVAVTGSDAKPVELNSPYTITVTPNAGSYIKTFTVGGNAVEGNTYKGTISADVAVTVEFAKKPLYNVTVNTTQDGTVTVDPMTDYEGQKVTVTPTATTEGYTLGTITAKYGTDNKDVALTRNSNGTYTFLMPAGDVTIDATFRAKEYRTVKVSSKNPELGTVTLNGKATLETTVKEGETVTINAVPTDSNIFKSWSINGTYDIKDSKTTSNAEITLVVNSNITATASFTQAAPYQVAYGENTISMYATDRQGIYVSAKKIDVGTTFTIFDSSTNQYAFSEGKADYWINSAHPTPSIVKWVGTYGDARKALNKYDTAKYVIFDSANQFITLSDTPEYNPKLTLYVKPGTLSYDESTGKDNSKYALSSVAKGLATTTTTPCNTYTVSDGDNITITTKMSETYKNLGYYVAAYCVNGVNYNASLSAEADTYQANITVSTDMAFKNGIEVTPIYYNKTIEANGDYITFYVNADEALKSWGNTLSVDPYCYLTGGEIVHFFEKYPGQPLVKDGQYYVTKISKYYYRNNNGTLEKTTDTVSGITLNNYYNDSVHVKLSPSGRNMQTYDFSDFVKLAEMENVKTIMFQNKFYNADATDAVKNIDYACKADGTAVTKLDNIADADTNKKVNKWQKFTDYYGRDTDVLGNILSDTDKNQPCIYVISTGSHDTTSQSYATKDEWATKWCVYDHSGKLITCGTPADFLDSTSTQYTALNKEEYRNKPVKISYEKGSKYSNGYSRSDGRWYYSALGQEFTSDVAIEYKGDDGTYIADTNTNTANTGFIGKTSGATATINDVTTASFSSVTDTAHLNIKVANGWRFDGWYINGNKIGDNYTDISTDILMSNSYNIVARVSQIPSGTLELNHTAYTGTDPTAHTGTGFYYISAVLYDQTGAVKHSYAETQGKISIDDFAATDSLEITLRAVAHGDNTIYAVYKGIDAGYFEIGEKDYEGDPSFSYTFKVSADSLFKGDELVVNALNYYTDIVKVGGTCDITYKYKDRFGVEGAGKMVSYVVRNVELSTEEIRDNYKPSDSTITKYAPRIDTMYVDTKWNLDVAGMVEKGKSQATVIATQTKKMCKVYHPTLEDGYYTDIADPEYYTVDYNSLLMDKEGNFLLSAPKFNAGKTKKFSYWEVYKVNANGEHTELVTKCYERNFGLRIMADYYIAPVYGEDIPSLTANINAPVLNREIYGDSISATDNLYADLLTAFTSTAIPTFKENTTNLSVECGVFVVRNNTSTLSVDDRKTLVDAAISNSTDTTSDILTNYKMTSQVETSVKNQLVNLAVDSSVKNNTNNTYSIGSDDYRVTKFVFDNNSLTNKNRIDKVLRYTNNTANQNYIFTAYAFVVIKDSHGTVKEMKISDPQYFNLCYVGNKAL